MAKDERQASGIDFWEGGTATLSLGKSSVLGHALSDHYARKRVTVDVVEGARVKGVLGVSVRPRWHGRG